MNTFKELGAQIVALPQKHKQKIVAIDGGGGAGKSTFATYLSEHIPGSVVVHIDDFYTGPWDARLDNHDYDVNPLFNWKRFEKEVLEPLEYGQPVSYHVYDWATHTEEKVMNVPTDATIVLEGGAVLQRKYMHIYDYKIWIEAPETERLAKALTRDGEHMRFLWQEDWLPIERNYIIRQQPSKHADLIVRGHGPDYSQGTFDTP